MTATSSVRAIKSDLSEQREGLGHGGSTTAGIQAVQTSLAATIQSGMGVYLYLSRLLSDVPHERDGVDNGASTVPVRPSCNSPDSKADHGAIPHRDGRLVPVPQKRLAFTVWSANQP